MRRLVLWLVLWASACHAMSLGPSSRKDAKQRPTTVPEPRKVPLQIQMNEFFRAPPEVQDKLQSAVKPSGASLDNLVEQLTAGPAMPGVPRPLWLVLLGSLPTGFLYYAYYKFCVEEELYQWDLREGRTPKGFGGYGTLGPFIALSLLGPMAFLFHIPGGMMFTYAGIAFVYYTQFLMYERINELYRDVGEEEPLAPYWCLPFFFPFDFIVGARAVHHLAQYNARCRGIWESKDPVVELFPFVSAPRFTWSEFLTTPALWCKVFRNVDPIPSEKLPEPVQQFLEIGSPQDQRKPRRKY